MSYFAWTTVFSWAKTCEWKGASWITCPLDFSFYIFGTISAVIGLFELATSHLALFAMNYDKKLTK